MKDFFAFRRMLSASIVRILYVLGMVALTFIGVVLLLSVNEPLVSMGGFLLITVGNLIWRLLCESMILAFSMHELLASIDRRLSHWPSLMREGGGQ